LRLLLPLTISTLVGGDYAETSDGVEITWGVNNVGHHALVEQLVPTMRSTSGGARVVVVSSHGHDLFIPAANRTRLDLNQLPITLDTFKAVVSHWPFTSAFLHYAYSKTANILLAVELDRREKDNGIRAYAVHPGLIPTAIGAPRLSEDANFWEEVFVRLIQVTDRFFVPFFVVEFCCCCLFLF
jgi:NAD(P)-dependent dehydrogenase (short-subunit alcohol dehydrogenase family)